jgi:hypothetical protein
VSTAPQLATTGGRRLGAGPNLGSAARSTATRSNGNGSILATADQTVPVKILGPSSSGPIPGATLALDKALGQWTDREVCADYADLALAVLLDVESASGGAKKVPAARRPSNGS